MNENLKNVVANIDKTFGTGSIQIIGQNLVKIKRLSSGSLNLDRALGGGYPVGRVIELMGWESSGKTTLAIHAIAECQKAGGVAAIVDAEHAFDPEYAANLGVDLESLLINQPDSGEQGLEIVDSLIKSKELSLIVVDSVAALVPQSELNGEMGDANMGKHARLMSQALRKIVASTNHSGCIVIFINQYRQKIGIMFGDPKTTTGGNALKFYASQRVDIVAKQKLKDKDDNFFGIDIEMKVIKNKVSPPFKKAKATIIYGQGIVKEYEVLDLAVEMEIVKKSGSWFSYGETKLGQGRDAVIQLLIDNPDLTEELEDKIKSI